MVTIVNVKDCKMNDKPLDKPTLMQILHGLLGWLFVSRLKLEI